MGSTMALGAILALLAPAAAPLAAPEAPAVSPSEKLVVIQYGTTEGMREHGVLSGLVFVTELTRTEQQLAQEVCHERARNLGIKRDRGQLVGVYQYRGKGPLGISCLFERLEIDRQWAEELCSWIRRDFVAFSAETETVYCGEPWPRGRILPLASVSTNAKS